MYTVQVCIGILTWIPINMHIHSSYIHCKHKQTHIRTHSQKKKNLNCAEHPMCKLRITCDEKNNGFCFHNYNSWKRFSNKSFLLFRVFISILKCHLSTSTVSHSTHRIFTTRLFVASFFVFICSIDMWVKGDRTWIPQVVWIRFFPRLLLL